MRRNSALALAVALAVGGCVLFAAAPARADRSDSKALFEAGVRQRKAGRCAEAITSFRRALEAWPEGIGALRNMALCQETLGRYASARRSWFDLKRRALKSSEPKYDGWEDEAVAAYERLAALVPFLTVRIEGAAPEEVLVRVDGRALTPKLLGVELERDVGLHRIEVLHRGELLARREIELGAAQREAVTMEVDLHGNGGGPSALLIAGIAATGVGTLGVAGVIVAAVVRQSSITELEDHCPGFDADATSTCYTASVGDVVDQGETASVLVNVFGAVAIAGIGAGVPMIVVATLGDDEPTGRISVAPGLASARLRVSF